LFCVVLRHMDIYIIIYIVKGLCPLVLRVADVLNELVVLSAQPS